MGEHDQGHFESTYRNLSNDGLLQLAIEGGLIETAAAALRAEMQRRSLSDKDAQGLKKWREQQVPVPAPVRKRTILGMGVQFVGYKFMSEADRHQRIFVATEFVVVKDSPFFPIGSYRLEEGGNRGLPRKIERIKLQGDQVWQEMRWTLLGLVIGFGALAVMIWWDQHKLAVGLMLRGLGKR